MDANRFFSVPFDNRNDVKMLRLRRRLGGMAAYGRWVALLGMLYDEGGMLDMNDEDMRWIAANELELDDVDGFFSCLADLGLIDKDLYEGLNHVVNKGVCKEVEYRKRKSEAGKLGAESRWNKGAKKKGGS